MDFPIALDPELRAIHVRRQATFVIGSDKAIAELMVIAQLNDTNGAVVHFHFGPINDPVAYRILVFRMFQRTARPQGKTDGSERQRNASFYEWQIRSDTVINIAPTLESHRDGHKKQVPPPLLRTGPQLVRYTCQTGEERSERAGVRPFCNPSG